MNGIIPRHSTYLTSPPAVAKLTFDGASALTLENIPADASKVELYRDGSLWSTKTGGISSPLAMNTYASGSYNARILDASDRLLAETTSVDATLTFDILYSSGTPTGSFTVTFPPMDYDRVELLSDPSGTALVTGDNTTPLAGFTFTGSGVTEGDYILRFVKGTKNYDHNVTLAVMFNTLALTRLGGNIYKYTLSEMSIHLEDGTFIDHDSHPSGTGMSVVLNSYEIKYYNSVDYDSSWINLFNGEMDNAAYLFYNGHHTVSHLTDTVLCVFKLDKKIRKPVDGTMYMTIGLSDGGGGTMKIYYGDIDHGSPDSTFFDVGEYTYNITLTNSSTYSARYVTDEPTITLDRKDDDEGNVEGNIEY